MTVPIIGLTPGDPAGVGPEILLRLLAEPSRLPPARFIIFAPLELLSSWSEILGFGADFPEKLVNNQKVNLRETGHMLSQLKPGIATAETGLASFNYFKAGVESALKGELTALVTGPVSKAAWHQAGLRFKGHTDYLEGLFPQAIMSFWSRRLKTALFTHHLPLSGAIQQVKKEPLLKFLLNLNAHLKKWNTGVRTLLVCGLNPHAGEEGLCGQEEIQEISPAVSQARESGLEVEGPFPPDTVFLQALDREDRMVVCLYHDQALIPFKLLAFDSGVNLTLGLPFIRTSPDHGTAFELAGKGIARVDSFREAIQLAWQLSRTDMKS